MPRKTKNRRRFSDKTPLSYDFEVFKPGTLDLDDVDLSVTAADRKAADAEILELQERLFELQVRYWLEKRRAVFVFEGWDAAGKGGAIKRLTALMDPRGYKVWPIAAPGEEERAHHYLWRFATRMPPRGTIAIFDRSWYGRVLVERIEGFARPDEWQRAYDEINAFERMHTDDGCALVKFFLHIDQDEQLDRFKQREKDPIKNFKIGDDDWRNRKRWKDYHRAYQDMFDRTHRPDAPWVVVASNDKRHARLAVLRRAIEALDT
ncbi:MAG: polyphosphate kinase [Myxococcaceae bacterium]|nr:polyphosphate kinase [Myxococcaceae bacterium]